MRNRITLGVSGDTNLIKTRLYNHPECVFPVSITKQEKGEAITYINFDSTEDLFVLDQYLGVVAEYIIDRYEIRLLKRILEEEYGTLSSTVKREILKNIEVLSDDPEVGYQARKQCVLLSVYDYLKEDCIMLIDGFVSFRLKEYEALLSRLTEKLLEWYLTRKEYNEFIRLLKYFVNIQEFRPELCHVCVGALGGYTILDEEQEDITVRCFSEFVEDAIMTEESYDDLLVSVLITLAPRRLIIHGAENIRNRELFSTISLVFDGAVEYCVGCEHCNKS